MATKSKANGKSKSNGASKAKSKRTYYDWNGAAENAKKGVMPTAPDMSAPTHRFFTGMLADAVKFAKSKDVKSLRAMKFKRTDGSPGMVKRYRDMAITALEAKK